MKGYGRYMGRGKLSFFNRYYEKYGGKARDYVSGRRLTKQEHKSQWFGTRNAFEKKAFADQVLNMGNKWFDYLDDLYLAGDKRAARFLDNLMENGRFDAQFNADFPDLWANFLKREGYDSILIRNTSVPIPGNQIIDDYFIALSKENVTAIVSG